MHVKPLNNTNIESEFHRAGWLVVNSDTIIQNGYVKVESGVITETGVWKNRACSQVLDHGPGILIPSLVNAHTHLELSGLKGKLPFGKEFSVWVQELIRLREKEGVEQLLKGVENGIDELVNSGCFVAGEISSLGISESLFERSALEGIFFREYLGGLIPEIPFPRDARNKNISYAGHAPHTSSPELLMFLKKFCRENGLVFSVHLAESSQEEEFIRTGKGSWAEFLKQRNIDFSSWGVPESSSVTYLNKLGVLDSRTLAVHLLQTDKNDIRLLAENKVPVCLCLRSNMNLHGRVPDVKSLYDTGVMLCIGTDSLASAESLSVFDEMKSVSEHFSFLSPAEIFKMATFNGAKALGLGKTFGGIEPGKSGKIVYLSIDVQAKADLFESMLT